MKSKSSERSLKKIGIANTAALICMLHFTAIHVKVEEMFSTLYIMVKFNQQQHIISGKTVKHVSLKSTFFMSTAPRAADAFSS